MSATGRDTIIREIPDYIKNGPRFNNLIGRRVNMLTVIGFNGRYDGNTYWVCKCDCGNLTTIAASNIYNKSVKSCGCINYKRIDLSGKKIGYLTVLEPVPGHKAGNTYWKCRCICGKIIESQTIYLTTNMKKETCNISCGCMNPGSLMRKEDWTTHGLSRHRLYGIYRDMCRRCNNPNDGMYEHYGGRGLGVCDDWDDPTIDTATKRAMGNPWFMRFFRWAYEEGGYYDQSKDTPRKEMLSLERLDVNKGYSPDNCTFIPLKDQGWNKTTSIRINDGEEVLNFKQFSEKYNIDKYKLRNMVRYWDFSMLVLSLKEPERGIHLNPDPKAACKYIDKDGFGIFCKKIPQPKDLL